MPDFSSAIWNKPSTAPAAYTVDNSLKFDGSTSYLSRTFGTPTDNDKWTWACWVKRAEMDTIQVLFGSKNISGSADGGLGGGLYFNANNTLTFYDLGSLVYFTTTAVYRDYSAWYHLAVTLDAAGDATLYVNGEEAGTDSVSGSSSINSDGEVHHIAREVSSTGYYAGVYLADMYFIDGAIVAPDDNFIETSSTTGQIIPKEYTVTGDNSFHLPFTNTAGAQEFADSSSSAHTITVTADATHTRAQKKVDGSSIYFDGSGDYLTIPTAADNDIGTGEFTMEFWVYPTSSTADDYIFQRSSVSVTSSYTYRLWGIYLSNLYVWWYPKYNQSGLQADTALTVDTWNHVAVVRDSSSDVKIYINGSNATGSGLNDDDDHSSAWSGGGMWFGAGQNSYFPGYVDEIRVSNIDRSGESDFATAVSHDDDDDTLLLIHSDWNGGVGADGSGNLNDFEDGGGSFGEHDQMGDSPSEGLNFCTWNPLDYYDATYVTLGEGNLKLSSLALSGAAAGKVRATFQMPKTLKWYWEIRCDDTASDYDIRHSAGLVKSGISLPTSDLAADITGADWVSTYFDGTTNQIFKEDTSATSIGSGTIAEGDIFQYAYDAATRKFWVGKNGTWLDSGDPSAGTDELHTLSDNDWTPFSFCFYDTWQSTANFGQDATFNGNRSNAPVTGGNGEFAYAPPTDFKSLCTANLPDPGLNNAVDDEKAFSTKIYTGDDGSSETGVGFQPDLTWIKNRQAGYSHIIGDSARGGDGSAMYFLASNGTGAESADTGKLVSLDSDGFTVGSHAGAGDDGVKYVAWNWKAGTEKTSSWAGDFSITPTKENYNADAGFSIIAYQGNSSGGTYQDDEMTTNWDRVPHTLDDVPELIFIKNREYSHSWAVWHKDLGDDEELTLDTTAAPTSNGLFPTSNAVHTNQYFTIGNDDMGSGGWDRVNGMGGDYSDGDNYIAYLFRSIEGHSKIGSYVGNGAADGNFIFCDFRPAFVWIKLISAAGEAWYTQDTARDTYNEATKYLQLENVVAEYTAVGKDLLSNGFKIRNTWDGQNNSSGAYTYIYYAVAELPFKYATAR